MTKFIFSLTALLLLSISFSLSAQTSTSKPSGAWQTQAMAYVKTLSRPIDIYTWEPRKNWGSSMGGIVGPNDPRAYGLLQAYAKSFMNSSDRQYFLQFQGPNGAYFATDPFVSREWGIATRTPDYTSKEWSLIRVTLPKGTQFIDSRSWEPNFPRELQQFVSGYGCSATSMRALFNVVTRPNDKLQCWSAYTEIVKQLKVYIVAKEFFALAPEYCVNHNTSITDFIIMDPNMDSSDLGIMKNFAVFVSDISRPDPVAEERLFIQDYWRLAKGVVERRYGTTAGAWASRWSPLGNFFVTSPYQFSLPWDQRDVPPTDLTSPLLRAKIEEKIFGCGNYREDRP